MTIRAVDNPGNFTTGPSYVYEGAYGIAKESARDVGITQGGVSYNHSTEFKEYDDADQYLGVVGVDKIGERMEVTFRMKENVLENLMLAWGLPTDNLTEGENKLTFGGNSSVPYKTLFIDGPAPGGGVANWQLWKVVPYSASEVEDTKDDNTVLEVTVLVIEDTTKTEGERFGQRVDTYSDTTAPSVDSISPADSASDVAVGTTLEVTFDEAIQQRDINSGNFNIIDDTGVEVSCSYSYEKASNKVVLTPDSDLSNDTTYLAFVSGEVRDMAGNAMGDNYRTSFTTEGV